MLISQLVDSSDVEEMLSACRSIGITNNIITVDLEEKASMHAVNVGKDCKWHKVELHMELQCLTTKQTPTHASPLGTEVSSQSPKKNQLYGGEKKPHKSDIIVATDVHQAKKPPENDIMKSFLKLLREGGLSAIHPFLENKLSLYLSDTGGQIEFQELLPLLVARLAIFVFLFPLNKSLDEAVVVSYRKKVGDKLEHSNVYTSSLTIKESLLQTLSSIDSMEGSVDPTKPKHSPFIFLVGTYRDCLVKELGEQAADKKIAEINGKLKELIWEHKYEKLVVYADKAKEEVFFAVDNTSQNDTFMKIRKSIMELLHSRDEFHIQFPLSYLLASLHLQDSSKPFVKRSDFAKEVLQYGIQEDDIDHLLQFLHSRIGQIRYFPLEEIREIIVKEPQALYNLVTCLITKSFISQCDTMKEFSEVQRGIFSLESFDDEEFLSQSKFLTPRNVINLLKELRIVAPFYDRASGVEKYFIPCVLNHLKESPVDDTWKVSFVQSLAIMFDCGHCPKGMFGVLLHYIITHQLDYNFDMEWHLGFEFNHLDWNLDINKIFKDEVSFEVGPYSEVVTIKFHTTYLEARYSPVNITHRDPAFSIKKVCSKIRSTLESGIVQATKSLHYSTEKTRYKLGLVCAECCQPHKVTEPYSMRCPKHNSFSLPNPGSFWFKVPSYFFPELGKNNTVVVKEGSNHQIQFTVDSDPPINGHHRLSKEGSSSCEGRYVFLDPATATINFKNIRKIDKGTYTITSSNDIGQGQASIRLEICSPPEISLDEDYLEVKAGSSPTVTCTVTSDPPLEENVCKLTLFRSDGTKATKRFKVEGSCTTFRKVGEEDSEGQGTRRVKEDRSRITFRNVKMEDSGTYIIRCCYDSEGNTVEATLELEVVPPTHPLGHNYGVGCTEAVKSRTLIDQYHYSSLLNQINPCQAKWESIAEHLGFLSDEIAAIKANSMIMIGGPEACLREVLTLWMRWDAGDARGSKDRATLEDLKAAISKAGFGKVANELSL